jgi:ribosomal protein S18 acetylase RimI-like enzyme
MSVPISPNLYERASATLLADWEVCAGASPGAALRREPGVASGVFPHPAERAVLNNAVFERGLPRAEREQAIEAMEAAYAEAGIEHFAAWVHESDAPLRADMEARGYQLNEANRMMGMSLDEIRLPRPEVPDLSSAWQGHLDYLAAEEDGVPEGFLAGLAPDVYHVANAGKLATAISFDFDGDCAIFNVGTVPHARRRGLGTALTALLVHDAADRGCSTASLQSTAIAERVYAAVGFRDLGLILEYVPGTANGPSASRRNA